MQFPHFICQTQILDWKQYFYYWYRSNTYKCWLV